ncbi:MAG: phosphoenolpyruvate--protein phosphotransferase [Verrucomicrobia bacterium]|nr:phosphoenolpyruvate--protein phosphotransferase [Verrucomicrobiota bacterium]
MPDTAKFGETVYKGIPVSSGVSHGKVLILARYENKIPKYSISDNEVARHIEKIEKALVATRGQILEIQRKVGDSMGNSDAGIFEAHILFLEDPILLEKLKDKVEVEHTNAEWAFHEISERYIDTWEKIDDEYLRERSKDMRDVSTRVLNNLLGHSDEVDFTNLTEPHIVVTDDLTPSMTVQLDRSKVLGFATTMGSMISHTAILARALKIPGIVGVPDIHKILKNDDYILLDGFNGLLIINPTDQTLFEYGQLVRKHFALEESLIEIRNEPAVTQDGRSIILSANIAHSDDADAVKDGGAFGVGLFRTEYLYLHRDTLPTEDEQYEVYRHVAAALNPQPLIIRTLDLGGDKFISHLQLPHEMNPSLGWRAIRFCLEEKAVFRAQLRAILRASAEGNIKLLYPMISGLNELLKANELLEKYKQELLSEGVELDENMDVGAMIEVPSAAMTADILAKHVQFFSIGTNDLIQYSLAIDRMNERISHLYEPTHPAILRLIKYTINASNNAGIWTGLCGEIAADLLMVPILIGLGIDELSASPPYVPRIKSLVRNLKMSDAVELADFALDGPPTDQVLRKSRELIMASAPHLIELQEKKNQ